MNTNQINEIIKEKRNSYDISLANQINRQTSFFVEKSLGGHSYEKEFLAKAKKLINNRDGYARFLQNLEYPLKTNQITSDIANQISKIFSAEDRAFRFKNQQKDIDFDLNFYKNVVFNHYLHSPNDLIYIQLNKSGASYEFISPAEIKGFEKENKDFFAWILIERQDEFIFIDDKIFQFFTKTKDGTAGALISEQKNTLGYVPIFHISDELFNSKSLFVRSNIFTKILPQLEEYQRLTIFKKIMSPYAFYMFITRYREMNCNYDNGIEHCEGGFLVDKNGKQLFNFEHGEVIPKKCPVCNQDLGIGNQIAMGKLFNADSWDVLEKPLNFIAPPTDILKYSDEFLRQKEQNIYNSILGIEQNLNDKVSHTAEAYQYNSQSREQILINLKSHFEVVIKNIENARIFPNEIFINLGTKFLITSIQDLMADLEIAEKHGLGEILSMRQKIIAKKYENDSLGRFRAEVLNLFYPNIPENELANLPDDNILKKRQIYFHNFISWFETNKRKIDDFIDQKKALTQLEKDFNNYIKQYNL